MRFLPFSLVAVALLLSACASGSDPGSQSGTREGRSDFIPREELAELSNLSAHEAVRMLRPRWLQQRRRISMRDTLQVPAPIVVIVDGARFGELDDLRNITVQDVESIRFIPGRDATTIYGTGYSAGVIEVTTRHRWGGY